MRAAALVLLGLLTALVITVVLVVPFPVMDGAEGGVDVARDFTAAQVAREEAFHDAVRPPAYASLLLGLLVAAVLGLTRLGSRLVARLPGHWTVQAVLATTLLLALGRLVTLPFDIAAERVLRRYGLSTQDWGSWGGDVLRGLAFAAGTTALVVVLLLALARAMPRRWWAAGAAAAALLAVGGSFVYPLLVEPAFNDFRPLAAGPQRDALLDLAERDGVPVTDVLVADASRRTTALNAYVSGFGSTRRIVVYDTLLRESPPREVQLVVAHELGHAKEQDVLVGTLLGALAGAAGICALALLLRRRTVLERVGASGAGDPRVIPFVLLLAAVTPVLLAPLTNLVSRQVEARADLHSLELTGDVATFVAVEKRLATTNVADLRPHPLVYAMFFTHPSAPERIAFAREWERRRR